MAGWFDGLFRGAAEAANRFRREGPQPAGDPRTAEPTAASGYTAGFRQGILDARAVAALRRSQEGRAWPRPADLWSDPAESDPRT
jgi:hypothetical protein